LSFVLSKKCLVQEFSWLYVNNPACYLSYVLILFSCMMQMCYSFVKFGCSVILSSAFEEGRFCEIFHSNASGWRSCETCRKVSQIFFMVVWIALLMSLLLLVCSMQTMLHRFPKLSLDHVVLIDDYCCLNALWCSCYYVWGKGFTLIPETKFELCGFNRWLIILCREFIVDVLFQVIPSCC